jgi:hypothetical protein
LGQQKLKDAPMPQHRMSMTTAQVERMFYVKVVDDPAPPPLRAEARPAAIASDLGVEKSTADRPVARPVARDSREQNRSPIEQNRSPNRPAPRSPLAAAPAPQPPAQPTPPPATPAEIEAEADRERRRQAAHHASARRLRNVPTPLVPPPDLSPAAPTRH